MTGLNNEKKRALAERLYINEGMTGKAIAEELDVSEQTIVRWKHGKNGEKPWDERRQQAMAAPHRIKELILAQMQKISSGEKSNIDADALIKMARALESIDKKTSVQSVISVLKEFDLFMADTDPAMAVKFLPYHKKFLHFKAATDGE